MQFVRNGPDIPERLLQAHEDGHVVFFCGAGISRPVLPDFGGLVKELYAQFGGATNQCQKEAIKRGQYDIAVELLEAEIVDGRTRVRRTLASILKTPTKPNKNTAHESLLALSKNCKGNSMRLITTNFDRLFEQAVTDEQQQVECFQAPLLPVPKKQWNGLVYLHGLLPEVTTPSKLDRLVVSSGDFGRAYLTERWASRFVSELFRNYIVCFIGYSLNDPVLRYMTDAIAADRQRGESAQEVFAFGSYSKGKEEEQHKEWKNKNVTPILYRKYNHHARLRRTLQEWGKAHHNDVFGKERIVAECATALPLKGAKEDGFVSRVMWALSDPSGLPAKHFAELDPVPSLDWLEPLLEERFNRNDLDFFGISPGAGFSKKDTFSLLHRPSPSNLAPYMALFNIGAQNSKWDEVMWRLAPWLTRHLNDPALLLRMANRGGSLHYNLVNLIESKLGYLYKLECDGNTTELERIRSNAPNAIPSHPMQTLWRLLLTGRVRSGSGWARYPALPLWKTRFKRYGLTTTLRLELRECLSPRVLLHKPINLRAKADDDRKKEHIDELVGWKIVLFADNALHDLEELAKDKHWIEASPELLTEFSSLLRDTLGLMRELGGADNRFDLSCILRPSISKHTQNRNIYDWTALIDLTCNAWLHVAEQLPERARRVAEDWSQGLYPLFRRLAFFAAAQGEAIPSRQGLDWLLADEHRWLWSAQTRREAMRLLVALAPRLPKGELIKLEKAILDGPPDAASENHIDHERQAKILDGDIRLRLTKIAQAGATLSENGRKKLAEPRTKHPDRKPAKDERDEFPTWTTFSFGNENLVATPRRRRELIKWLKQHTSDHWDTDDWQQRCRNDFTTTACTLCALAKEGHWFDERWSVALRTWSEEKLTKSSWRYMAPVLASATDEQLQPFALDLSWWLKAVAKTFVGQDEIFLALCKRALELKDKNEPDSGDDYVTRALHHPVGGATQALLNWWCRRALEDGQGLPDDLKPIFTKLCFRKDDKFRHGRVFLAGNLMSLFRVDQKWTKEHLLPLFGWQNSKIEACAVWQGFLISPRLYSPLMEVLKRDFLETASHYEMIANYSGRRTSYGEQYASLLTYAALNLGDTFETKELAAATRSLSRDGLHYAAQALVRMIEGINNRRDNYFRNRVAPYIREIWPKTWDKIYPDVMTDLGRVCIAAQDSFPEAFDLLKHWLQPTSDPSHYHNILVQKLHETEICSQFPKQALDFLDLVIPEQQCYIPRELRACLETIQISKPELGKDAKCRRLMVCVRQQEH